MPFSGFRCVVTQEPVWVSDCIAHAISEGSQLNQLGCPFTPAILRGIAHTLEDEPTLSPAFPSGAPNGSVRVTHLLACAKRVQWQRDHPYWMDPRDAYAMFRGQIGHAIIERHHGDEILLSEERLNTEFDGVTLTGKPDAVLDTERRHLDDYKTTRFIPKSPYDHHIAQLNLYAWLLHQAKNLVIGTASIVYLDMAGVARLPAPVWPLSETEAYLRERITLWKQNTATPVAYECKSCPLKADCPDAKLK